MDVKGLARLLLTTLKPNYNEKNIPFTFCLGHWKWGILIGQKVFIENLKLFYCENIFTSDLKICAKTMFWEKAN